MSKPPIDQLVIAALGAYLLPHVRHMTPGEVLTPEEAAASAMRRAEAYVQRVEQRYPEVFRAIVGAAEDG